jgi:hypothetical protein
MYNLFLVNFNNLIIPPDQIPQMEACIAAGVARRVPLLYSHHTFQWLEWHIASTRVDIGNSRDKSLKSIFDKIQ